MKKDKWKEYYGIYFNDDEIPKIDKVNKYKKEVKIKFEGQAYLIERDDDGNIIEREELENEYIFKKEDDYEIEFINNQKEVYYIYLRIRMSYLFIILLLFLLGFIIGMLLSRPKPVENLPLSRFFNYINLAVLQVDIDKKIEEKNILDRFINRKIIKYVEKEKVPEKRKEKPAEKEYHFDVEFDGISLTDIDLTDTISAESLVKNKIAPGVRGNFAIKMSTQNSSVDMKYSVKFEDITKEKPTNMMFKIRGSNQEYSSLQELEKDLIGIINKRSKKIIIIDWQWNYQSGSDQSSVEKNDLIDTDEGKNLTSYKFKIAVNGEEVIE